MPLPPINVYFNAKVKSNQLTKQSNRQHEISGALRGPAWICTAGGAPTLAKSS